MGIASETFVVAWRRLEDVPEEALPWLYGVARRVLANERRAGARRERLSLRSQGAVDVPRVMPDVQHGRELREASARLYRARRRLVAWLPERPDGVGLTGETATHPASRVGERVVDRRTFAYGLLGPDAKSLAYRYRGHRMTVKTVGPQGAYLVVLPAATPSENGIAVGAPGFFPGVLAVSYRDGLSCRPGRPSPACVRKQSAPLTAPLPRIGLVRAQTAIRRHQRGGKRYADLVVRFRAPVAITQAILSYWLAVEAPAPCNITDLKKLDRDVGPWRAGHCWTCSCPATVPAAQSPAYC